MFVLLFISPPWKQKYNINVWKINIMTFLFNRKHWAWDHIRLKKRTLVLSACRFEKKKRWNFTYAPHLLPWPKMTDWLESKLEMCTVQSPNEGSGARQNWLINEALNDVTAFFFKADYEEMSANRTINVMKSLFSNPGSRTMTRNRSRRKNTLKTCWGWRKSTKEKVWP